MRVVSIMGLKGGCGKTTLAGNLGAEMVALGRSVQVLDCDPQQSLVAWSRWGEGVLSRIVEPCSADSVASLRGSFRRVSRVIIDTPPELADPAVLACLVADLVLLPCGASPLDLIAAKEALEVAREARKRKRNLVIRFVPTRIMAWTHITQDLMASLDAFKEGTLTGITSRVAVAESVIAGLSVGEYQPNSPAHREFEELTREAEELFYE